uniref:Uncharacterized protein n=1 Tax=Panagrolaimus davidi TaxID=227884 RepID=A0A914P5Y4_9BILA
MSTTSPILLNGTFTTAVTVAANLFASTTSAIPATPAPPGMYWRIKVAMDQVAYGITAFDFSFVIVCLFNIFTKNNHFRSPYFVLLLFSTAIRGFTFFVGYIKVYNSSLNTHWLTVTGEIWRGFSIHWHGIIILALALNRGTALGMPFRHQQVRCCEK